MNKRCKIKYISIAFIIVLLLTSTIIYSHSNYKKELITIGFMHNLFFNKDINDEQAAIKVWVDNILKNNKLKYYYSFRSKIYENFNEVSTEMKSDSLSAVVISTIDYLKLGSKIKLQPALVPVINNEVGYKYYLLVKKNDNYNSLKDLQNTSIGLSSERVHTASILWLEVTLAKINLPSKDKFFKNIKYSGKESDLVLDLFFGKTDACIVSDYDYNLMKELNPQIGNKLKIIAITPRYLRALFCFTKLVGKEEKDVILNSAITFQTLSAGKQLFTLLNMEKIESYKPEYIESYKTLLKEHDNLVIKNN